MTNDANRNLFSLTGHTALITGSTQGVGAEIAVALAKAGANVCLHGLCTDDMARQTLQRCEATGCKVALLECDLAKADDESLDLFCSQADAAIGPIDLLVNNAGTYIDLPFLEMTRARYEHTMRLNVEAAFFLTQWFARRWVFQNVRGRVLFTGSINAVLSEPTHVAYDASKGAVAALVRSLCVSLAPLGIRVNALAPGLVRTPLTNQVLSQDAEVLAWMQLHTPNGMVPDASVCGGAAVFLLSDAAEHIHGQTLLIDGGMSVWQQPDLPHALRGSLPTR